MSDRNYPCDSIIQVYFGAYDFNLTGEDVFKKQLFHCMIGQALEMKANIERRRSTNQFGTLIWQFNEIWPTGGTCRLCIVLSKTVLLLLSLYPLSV